MKLLSVFRRWALRDQLSIREIARRPGLSRNTIRKYLRGDLVELAFKLPERPRYPASSKSRRLRVPATTFIELSNRPGPDATRVG
jgi:transcriptional regulator with XRE-family HTH domain